MKNSRANRTPQEKSTSRGKAGGSGAKPGDDLTRLRKGRLNAQGSARASNHAFAALTSLDASERSQAAGAMLARSPGPALGEEARAALLASIEMGWDDKHRTSLTGGRWARASCMALAFGPQGTADALWRSGWRFDMDSAAEFYALGGLSSRWGLARASLSTRREALAHLAQASEPALWAALSESFFSQQAMLSQRFVRGAWPMLSDPLFVAGLAHRHGAGGRKALAWRCAFAGCCHSAEALAPNELNALEALLRKSAPEPGVDAWRERMELLWVAGSSSSAEARLGALSRAGRAEPLDWRALGPEASSLSDASMRETLWSSPAAWAQLARPVPEDSSRRHAEVVGAFKAQSSAMLPLPNIEAAHAMVLAQAPDPEGAQGAIAARFWLALAAQTRFEAPSDQFGGADHDSLPAVILRHAPSSYGAVLGWAASIGKLDASWSRLGGARTLEELARDASERADWEKMFLQSHSAAPEHGSLKVRL
jgi:hypothetical protein